MGNRIIGYDLARAAAVFGMVVVNFKIVMGAGERGPEWLLSLVGLLEGRAAATFVVLAGAGISLFSQEGRTRDDRERLSLDRLTLLKRALLLFVIGALYTPIWPADILHFYGVYIAVAAFLLAAPSARLWTLAVSLVLAFCCSCLTMSRGGIGVAGLMKDFGRPQGCSATWSSMVFTRLFPGWRSCCWA